MCVERIRGAFDRGEIEGDADLGAERLEALMHLGKPRIVTEFRAHVGLPVEALGGNRRIELERAPLHRDIAPPDSASAASNLRLPTKHQGQTASLTTSMVISGMAVSFRSRPSASPLR